MTAQVFSRFGMAQLQLALAKGRRWLEVIEVRPLFNPHPPERLTKDLASLLPHLVMSVNEDLPKDLAPEIAGIRSDLQSADPDKYTGNAYRSLMNAGLLPRGGTWALVRGVAECTPDDEVSNRTRWALQMLFVQYLVRFGAPKVDSSFLYVWHDVAFQFAGQSRTIGKAAWGLMQLTPHVTGEWLGSRIGCAAVYATNQPDGTIPFFGVAPRMSLDLASRLFFE